MAIFIFNAARAATPENFDATTEAVGWQTNGLETPDNQLITPAGIFVELRDMRPNALALSPDGKLLVTSGLKHELVAVNPATGKILQRAPFPEEKQKQNLKSVSTLVLNANLKDKLSFTGIAFSPDGSRIYLSNVNGNIKVFGIGKDHRVVPLFSLPLPPANAPERTAEIPAGIAVSADGKQIYVAGNLSNRLLELDAGTGKLLRTWSVGIAPYDVVLAGKKIYVSNWGGRRPDARSLTGPAGRGTLVRVDSRAIASEGSVSVIDLTANDEHSTSKTEILTGSHACALALSPNGKFLACANAGDDTVSV
ncbi:MAG: YncE family protein, partial [Limisphaerales bacterium]